MPTIASGSIRKRSATDKLESSSFGTKKLKRGSRTGLSMRPNLRMKKANIGCAADCRKRHNQPRSFVRNDRNVRERRILSVLSKTLPLPNVLVKTDGETLDERSHVRCREESRRETLHGLPSRFKISGRQKKDGLHCSSREHGSDLRSDETSKGVPNLAWITTGRTQRTNTRRRGMAQDTGR